MHRLAVHQLQLNDCCNSRCLMVAVIMHCNSRSADEVLDEPKVRRYDRTQRLCLIYSERLTYGHLQTFKHHTHVRQRETKIEQLINISYCI
jgi:hypothetical protein